MTTIQLKFNQSLSFLRRVLCFIVLPIYLVYIGYYNYNLLHPYKGSEPYTQEAHLQIQQQFNHLLSDNGGCAWPCWWGLAPGDPIEKAITQFEQIKDERFEKNGWISRTYDLKRDGYYMLESMDHTFLSEMDLSESTLDITVSLYYRDDTIRFIHVRSINRSIYGRSKLSPEDLRQQLAGPQWNQFAIQSILRKLGEPTNIYLWPTHPGLSNHGKPIVGFYYLEQGVMMVYSPRIIQEQDNAVACLNPFDVEYFWLGLYEPHTINTEFLLNNDFYLPVLSNLEPEQRETLAPYQIETILGTTISEFTDVLSAEDNEAGCFDWVH